MTAKSKTPMPEQIIAWRMRPSKVNEDLHGGWAEAEDKREVSYTRTDVAQAMAAAAYDSVVNMLRSRADTCEFYGENESAITTIACANVARAITPTDAKAALDRLIAEAVKEALQVKPLVWLDKGSRDGWMLRWQAGEDGCRWHYQITQQVSIGQSDYTLSCGLTGKDVGSYKTVEEARTAAQARYEARILSALKGGEA